MDASAEAPSPTTEPAASPRAERNRFVRVALPAILLLAALLRLHDLTREGLWYDEALSVSLAVSAPADIIPLVRRFEQIPPLHHLMLAGWIRLFGQSETSVRLPSVIAGVFGVWGVFRIGGRLFGFAGAVAAGLLMATAPFHVFFSQEARAYMLLLALGLWSSDFYLIVVTQERATRRVRVAYVLTTAALLYSHPYGGLVLLAQNLHWLGVWLHRGEPRVRIDAWIALQGFVALLFAPWMPTMWRWTRSVSRSFWIQLFGFDEITRSLWIYAGSASAMVLLTWFAVIGVANARGRRGIWLLVLLIVTGVIAPVALSMVISPVFTPRYGMVAAAALLILAAGGIAALRYAALQVLVLAIAIALPLAGWDRYREAFSFFYVRQDWRGATAYLREHMRRGDYVAINPAQGIMAYGYYQPRQDVEEIAFVDPDIPIDRPLRRRAHVWLIVHGFTPAGPIIRSGNWRIVSHKFFQGIQIYRLAPSE